MSSLTNINLTNYYDFIITNVVKIQNTSIPSKEDYEKMVIKSQKRLDCQF